jgi:hypothetical protein
LDVAGSSVLDGFGNEVWEREGNTKDGVGGPGE